MLPALGCELLDMDSLRSELTAKLDSHFKWTIGTLITLTGLVVVVFKR